MNDTITIVGNLADDPTHTVTTTGVPITSFRVGSTRRHFNKAQGAWVEDGTNWYSVSVFRNLAHNARESLRKGQRVVVHGKVKMREWDNGTKKGTSVDIEAEAVGHDLTFGTSSFTPTSQRRAPEPEEAAADRTTEDRTSADRTSADRMTGGAAPVGGVSADSWAVAPVGSAEDWGRIPQPTT